MLPHSKYFSGQVKKIVGFWGSWSPYSANDKFLCSDIDPQLFTHLVYTYLKVTESCNIDFALDKPMIEEFIALKLQNVKIKLLASVGGSPEFSKFLSQISAKADSREIFVSNTVKFLNECGLDGLDINWNLPTKNDKDNFVLLLKELRIAFNVPKFILTATVNPTKQRGDDCYNAEAISKTVDFVNLLAFDLHGVWEKKTAANAPLYAGSLDHPDLSVDACVRYWSSKVDSSTKLVLGVGTYGKLYQLTDSSQHGIGASISAEVSETLSYPKILDNGWETNWSSSENCPYAFSGDKWVTFENEESIEKKANYAKEKKLGGILIYSVEFDNFKGENGQEKFPLVKAARKVLCE